MKKYINPTIEIERIVTTNNIASGLTDWLSTNNFDSDISITTYTFPQES